MKTFRKTFRINTEPADIYSAITNPYTIELWSGYPARMSTEPGSEFSLWEGDITGLNLEFVNDKKIVQEWYFGEQEEQSIVTLLLHEVKHGTSIELIHTGIPDGDYDDIIEGWNRSYFGSLHKFYEE